MSALTLTAGGDNVATEYQQPPVGDHKAILVGIVESKNEQTAYGPKDLVFFYFELEEKMDDGRPFSVRAKFTKSLNEKSNLYKFLNKWRGKPFAAGEQFDLNEMVGVGCILELIAWSPKNDPSVIRHLPDRARPLPKKEWPKASGDFDAAAASERIEKWKEENGSAQPAATPAPIERTEDDDVPF
jgi:hypothetical protein